MKPSQEQAPREGKNLEFEFEEADPVSALRESPEFSKYAPPMSTSDVDVENQCKQLEAQIEPLIRKLEEFKLYNGKHRYRRRRALERQRCKVKRQLANIWRELIVLKQESTQKDPKRWSLHKEVETLFTVALKLSYPEFKDMLQESDISVPEYGDFFCEDVLKIWPILRREGKAHPGPRRVGYEIKKNVQVQQLGMVPARLPFVLDIGFVLLIVSGKWMAKSLHKLLRDGVDTWAPPLFVKNYLVNIYFPTCDTADLSVMDSLRRELIKETLINILEYCKVDWCSMPCGMDLPQEESDKFRTMIRDEDVLIFPNAEGKHEPLIRAKGGSSDPLIDLKNLWYGLEEKRADWIVCLTPVQQQEYIQMCFRAAQHAKWLPSDQDDLPRASYTGYQSCNTSMEDLVAKAEEEDLHSLLAKLEAKVSKAGYTIEEVLKSAVKYSFLKNHRLDVRTFSFEEMLDEEEDTFVYLLNTQVRNRSFTNKHREVINELKRASELTLGEDEIWDEGEERVLVLRLLEFTQVITSSCYPVLPHKLCYYLYVLSRSFNGLCDSWEVGIAGIAETTLLLCKATEVVMEKGFQLLGINRGDKHESLGFLESLLQVKKESLGLPKSVLQAKQESQGLPKSWLQVGRLNHRDPPKKPNSRFLLFSVYIDIRDPTVKECMVFGKITISDTYGLVYHGWGLPDTPDDGGTVALFHSDIHDQIRVTNHGELDLGNPSQAVPLSSSMEISAQLYASTLKEDALFTLPRSCVKMDFADFWKLKLDTKCGNLLFKSDDGDVRMYYALLRDAVDCVIHVRHIFKNDREVDLQIYATYRSFDYKSEEDLAAKNCYTASLYDGQLAGRIGRVPLQRSMMAVPAKGSIVIKARLREYCDSKKHGHLDGDFMVHAQPENVCNKKMRGSCGCCSLIVSVIWRERAFFI